MKYYEVLFTITAPEPAFINNVRDVVAALAGEAGFESFLESGDGLTGYVQQDLFNEPLLKEQLNLLPFDGVVVSYRIEEAAYRDWNEQWEEEGFSPITLDNGLVIHDGRHLPEDTTPERATVEIDARMAFGTGTHETTRLMANAIAALPLKGKIVLDCGTGTGILAIVALKCGADRVVGYDIDEWSVKNAVHNAGRNGVENSMTVLHGDAAVLKDIDMTFHLVVANINRNILLNDMETMCSKMATEGLLLISGFYSDDTILLKERASALGLTLQDQWQLGEWACLLFANDR